MATRFLAFIKFGESQLAAFVLIAALVITAIAYAPGLTGTFHFDDFPNLHGLTHIADESALALPFVTDGIAGPFGRPISLASFVPQAYAWPVAPEVFLYVNILLHLLNGALVVWVLYLLSLARDIPQARAAWIASMSGALWMLLPLLASSSLLVIQRMTTLSAMFSLLGLVGYLYARRLYGQRPLVSLALMTLALVSGTVFATLSKENGILLVLFVLITEATLLRKPYRTQSRLLWNMWFSVVLLVPAAMLIGYLSQRIPYSDSVIHMRGFSGSERLLTQAHVLWEYLFHAFLPSTANLGPFHDDYRISNNWLSLSSILAVGGWLITIACAIVLRQRLPLFAFAIAWYLVGHSLESTTIPLELYFEHRNYMPLIGPVFALISAATNSKLPQPLVKASLFAYALMLSAVLISTTSLWGRPALAAEMWYLQHPSSARAAQYVAQQLHRTGDLYGVRRVLTQFSSRNTSSSATALQALMFSCIIEPDGSHYEQLRKIKANIPGARFEYSVFNALEDLYRIASDEQCGSLDRATVYELTTEIAGLPAYRAVGVMQHNLHLLMSEEGVARRDLNLTMHHIETAMASHYTITSLIRAVQILVSAGLHSVAAEFVDVAYERKPTHPIRRARWDHQLEAIENAVQAISLAN